MSAEQNPPMPPAAAAPASGSALDRSALAQLAQLDPGDAQRIVARVLRAFGHSLAKAVDDLARAREAGDSDRIRLIAHTLKSSSATVGALHLAGLCRQIELEPLDEPAGAAPPMLQAVAEESVRIQAEIAAILERELDEP